MRTKRAFKVKEKALFIIFKGLSGSKNCLRPEGAPLKIQIQLVPIKQKLCTLEEFESFYLGLCGFSVLAYL